MKFTISTHETWTSGLLQNKNSQIPDFLSETNEMLDNLIIGVVIKTIVQKSHNTDSSYEFHSYLTTLTHSFALP